MKSRTGIALSLVLLGASVGPARAEFVTFSFQGNGFPPGTGFPVRDPLPLSGSITYNTQGSLVSSDGIQSTFTTTGSITISAGSSTSTTAFGPSTLLIKLEPDQMIVSYQSWPSGSPLPKTLPWLLLLLGIDATSPAPIFTDISSLPSRLPPGLTGPLIVDGHFRERDLLLQGNVYNIAPASVAALPETGSLALAATGSLLGLACVARRRRLAP
jgi:hypothetical protein